MKKYLCLFLALLTVLMCFASCGGKDTEENTSAAPSETESAASEASAAESTTYQDMLGDPTDLGGREFYIMQRWFGYGKPTIDFQGEVIWQESEDGTLSNINLAKRKVLDAVQEKYNCKVTGEMSTEQAGPLRDNVIRADIMSTQDIDFCFETYYYYYSFIKDGLLADLNTLGIQFDKPWWDQNAVEDLTVAGKLYYALGDINTYDNDGTVVVLFNKDLYEEKFGEGSYQELYDLAADGKWTFDELAKRVTGFGTDSNGDGVRDEKDSYGLLTNIEEVYFQMIAAGEKSVGKDANGSLELTLGTERAFSSVDKTVDLLLDTNDVLVANLPVYTTKFEGEDVHEQTVIKAFKEGRGLFYTVGLIHLPYFRDMEDDFGILPMPKHDETQQRYYHTMSPHTASVVFVPVGKNSNGERGQQLGILLDALGAYSKDYLTPEYYEKQLKRGDASDPDSAKMLDVIFENRTFDLGAVFGQMLSDPYNMCNYLDHGLQARLDAQKDIIEMSIEDIMDKFNEE